jgi:hypothetical protein
MISSRKLFPEKGLKLINLNNILICIFFLLIVNGCTKEKQKEKYVARVNNQYLTEKQLDKMTGTSQEHLYRSEVIRNWINREVLYQEASRQGILNDSVFKDLLGQSKKELASSLLLQKVFLNQENNVDDVSTLNFYNNNINDFKTYYDAYFVNRLVFSEEQAASKFHSQALEKNWQFALSNLNDSSLVLNEENKLLYEYEIEPVSLLKIIKELLPDEISIVVKNEAGNFEIVQLLRKFDKNSVLPYDLVKSKVRERFLVRQKDSVINSYIKDLYSKNEIEVKN